jgi:hypothetical protein
MSNTHPTPRSANVRRHPSGMANVELFFGEDQVQACRRCPARCKARPIGADSTTYRCGHRMSQDQLPGFLFGTGPATPQEEETGTTGSDDGDTGFSAASGWMFDILGRDVIFIVWTDVDWAIEASKPADAWPLQGGGWLRVVVKPKNHQKPVVVRPWEGPAPRSWWEHWVDLEVDLDGIQVIYRVILGSDHGTTPPRWARPLIGNAGFTWIGIDCDTYLGRLIGAK